MLFRALRKRVSCNLVKGLLWTIAASLLRLGLPNCDLIVAQEPIREHVEADPSLNQLAIAQSVAGMQSEMNERWLNGDTKAALELAFQIRDKLIADHSELSIRLAYHYDRLTNFAYELGKEDQARQFSAKVTSIYRGLSDRFSWASNAAEHYERQLLAIEAMSFDERLAMYDTSRAIQQAYESREFRKAKLYAEQLAKIYRSTMGERHPLAIQLMAYIQVIRLSDGETEFVDTQLQRAKIELSQSVEPGHPLLGVVSSYIAYSSWALQDGDATERHAKEAVDILEACEVTFEPNYVDSLQMLAAAMTALGKHDQAVEPLREAYKIVDREGLRRSARLALVEQILPAYGTVADDLWIKKEFEKAEALLQEAYSIAVDTFGEKNFRTVNVRLCRAFASPAQTWTDAQWETYDGASALDQQRRKAESEEDWEQALEFAKERYEQLNGLLGEANLETLNARFDVIRILFLPAISKTAEDQSHTEGQALEFLRIFEQHVGMDNIEFLNKALSVMGQRTLTYQARLELSKKVLQGSQNGPGIKSFEYARAFTIDACLQLNSELDDDDSKLLKAIEIWDNSEFVGTFEHCQALMTLGIHYYENSKAIYEGSKFFSSRQYLESAEEYLRKLDPTRTAYELAVVLNYLGVFSSDVGRFERAIDYHSEAIQLFESASVSDEFRLYGKTLDTYTGIYQWCLYNAATAHEELRDYGEALTLLKKLMARFPEDSPRYEVMSSLYKAIVVAARMNDLPASNSFLQRLQTIVDKHHADDPLEHGKTELIHAKLHLITNDPKPASGHLDKAFDWLKKIDGPNQLVEKNLNYFDAYILNLREMYEELHQWSQVVAVRRFAVATEEAFYNDSEILRTLQQELKLFEAIAELEPEQQSVVGQLLDDTRALKATDPANVDPDVLARSKDLMYRVIDVLGPTNLACFYYAIELARVQAEQEALQQASELLVYAITTGLELLGERHEHCIEAYTDLARVEFKLGQYSQAIQMASFSLANTAEGSIPACEAELEVARSYAQVRDYPSAMKHARTALNGFTGIYGRLDERVADALSIRGTIYYGLGQPELGYRDLQAAHRIAAKLFDDSDSRYLRSLAALAMSTHSSGKDFETAKGLFNDCIARYETANLTETLDYLELLASFADALHESKDVESARALYERALSLTSSNSFRFRSRQKILFSLGVLHRKRGDLAVAEKMLSESLHIQETLFGASSDATLETRFQAALTQQLLGNSDLALTEVRKTLEASRQRVERDALLLNDTALTNLLDSETRPLDLLISAVVSTQLGKEPNQLDKDLIREAYAWTFRNKGLSLDLSCRQNALEQRLSYDSNIMTLRERQRVLIQQLADLSLNDSDGKVDDSTGSKIEQLQRDLSEVRDSLAAKLMASNQADLLRSSDWLELANKLDEKTVLLDFLKVRLFLPASANSQIVSGEEHYVAFCIRRQQEGIAIDFEDLGRADDLERQIQSLRDSTRRVPKRSRISSEESLVEEFKSDSAPIAQSVFSKFYHRLLSDSTIVISPDGALCFLPFHALVGSDDRFMIESFDFAYVSSGRDLLREHGPVGKGTLVLSNPNFDANTERLEQKVEEIQLTPLSANTLVMRGSSVTEDIALRSLRWKQLPAAELEAFDTKELLDGSSYGPVSLYVGDAAMEEVFKASYAVRIIHLATHGYYIPLQNAESQESLQFDANRNSNLARLRSIENPLLRSGIVLAGANRVRTGNDQLNVADGWVTAQEIARMDFRSTELVMLSACESGLGDVSSGQGVQGIRRAFINAGAHNIVTSLFEVPDAETRELIQKFYKHFSESGNCRQAICQAQRDMIRIRRNAHGAAHPFFWASFVLFGDPTSATQMSPPQ